MNCPYCMADTKVVDTVTGINIVIRKRKCVKCGRRFNTSELQDDTEETKAEFTELKRNYMGKAAMRK